MVLGGISLVNFLKLYRYPDKEVVEVYGIYSNLAVIETVEDLLKIKAPYMQYKVDHIINIHKSKTGLDTLRIVLKEPGIY